MLKTNRFVKVKEHKNPREKAAENELGFDPMTPPHKLTSKQLDAAIKYFFSLADLRKDAQQQREQRRSSLDRFLHPPKSTSSGRRL